MQQNSLIALQQQTIQHLTELLRSPGEDHPLSLAPDNSADTRILCEHWSAEGKNIVSVNVKGDPHSAIILDRGDEDRINIMLDCDEKITECKQFMKGYEGNVDLAKEKLAGPPSNRIGYRKNFLERLEDISIKRIERLSALMEEAEIEKQGACEGLSPLFAESFYNGDIRIEGKKNWLAEIESWPNFAQNTNDRPRSQGGQADDSDHEYISDGYEDAPVATDPVFL